MMCSRSAGRGRGRRVGFLLGTSLAGLGVVAEIAQGHGYHGAAVTVASMEAWEQEKLGSLGLTRIDPGVGEESGEKDAGADLTKLEGGSANTPYQRTSKVPGSGASATIGELANVLAWLHPANIIPDEFPKFELAGVPKYREIAKNMLAAMGPDAYRRLLQDLTAPPTATGMTLCPTHTADILDTLGRMGRLDPDPRVTGEQVLSWLAALRNAKLSAADKEYAARAAFSLLTSSELKKLKVEPKWRKLWLDELMQRLIDDLHIIN